MTRSGDGASERTRDSARGAVLDCQARLTPNECAVFLNLPNVVLACMLGRGLSDKDIARITSSTEAAVRSRVARVMTRGRVRTRAALAATCARLMLLAGVCGTGASCAVASSCRYSAWCADAKRFRLPPVAVVPESLDSPPVGP